LFRYLTGGGNAYLKTGDVSTASAMSTVSLKNVYKIYDGKIAAVSDFNIEIADKEFVVFVGPSGCGKSTTLRMVAGLEEITQGEIYIDGRLVNEVEPKNRDIAMVFQNYALYPHMTVRGNMEFPLKLAKYSKNDIKARVEQAAEILGITEYLDRKPKTLSGGQRQRVAIGRAIVREPKVLLMDEPLSNLDAKLRNQMRAEIIKLRQRISTTFIYVTHDQTEAMTLGDRIVIMKDGFIQQIGTPREVFDHPINQFVAGFIGSPQMNLFPAKLIQENGKYCVCMDDVKVELSDEKQVALTANLVETQTVTLGVRPNHIILNDGYNAIRTTIDVSEMMGSEIHLHTSENEKDVVIIVPTMDAGGKPSALFAPGDVIHFTFGGNVCNVFDANGHNLECRI